MSTSAAPVSGHILLDLKAYIERHNQVSLRDLALHFHLEPDALRFMLDHWIRKGRVKRLDFTPDCGCGCGTKRKATSCNGCGVEDSFEIYAWQGSAR